MDVKDEIDPLSAMSAYRPRITCQLCGKEFSQLDKLSFHIYNNCQDNADAASPNGARSAATVVKLEDGPSTLPDQDGSTENDDGSGKQHVCDICGKQFPKLQNLQVHVRSHTGEKPYSCQWCGKTFTSYGNMKAHSRVHTGLRPHQCPTCGKEFGTAQNLQVHIRTHTGERPYKCSECGKGFAGQGNLKVHQRTHTGERPYKCQMCGKDFRNLQSLHIHVRSHTGEKPYECSFCHKAFTSQGNMQAHMRIHTGERPFSCGECDKSFANMQALKIHIRTHTGERPHVCGICGKDFASLGNFQVHLRTHSGLKAFTCRMCAHEFPTLSGMQEHMVRTHATELYTENALLWTRMQHLSALQMQMPGTSGSADNSLLGIGPYPQAGFPTLDFSLGLEQMMGISHKPASATVTNEAKDIHVDDSKIQVGGGSSDTKDKTLKLSSAIHTSKASEGASAGSENSLNNLGSSAAIGVSNTTDKEHENEDFLKKKTLDQSAKTQKAEARTSKLVGLSVESPPLHDQNNSSQYDNFISNLKSLEDPKPSNSSVLNSNGVCRKLKPRSASPTLAPVDGVFDTGCERNTSENGHLRSGPRVAETDSGEQTSDGVPMMLGPSFGDLHGSTAKMTPEASFASPSSDNAFGGLATRLGPAPSVGDSELFSSRMQPKTSTLDNMDASVRDLFSMNRTMQYGYHLPPLSSFAMPSDYAMNMLRGQGPSGDSLHGVSDGAVNMFGYASPYMPSVGPAKHFMDMFSLPGVQGHNVEGHGHSTVQGQNTGVQSQRLGTENSSGRNPFQLNQSAKPSLSPTELNTFVQTALDMFSSERNANSQYSDLLETKGNQADELSYCGSGGPVFPTNM